MAVSAHTTERRRTPLHGLVAALLGALTLAACATTQAPEPPPSMPPGSLGGQSPAPVTPSPVADPTPEIPRAAASNRVTPPHLSGVDDVVRMAVLLPFSARSPGARAEAASMLDAAQLALFSANDENLVLFPRDTRGTADGARAAAQSAIADGADVIIGPLFADAVRAVALEAERARVPVLAFSNDRTVAGRGAYLVGATPEDEVARIITFAAQEIADAKLADAASNIGFDDVGGSSLVYADDAVRFALLTPANSFGERVRVAAEQAALEAGARVVVTEYFEPGGDAGQLTPPVSRIARFGKDPNDDESQVAFDAVLLPDGGVGLRSLAPLLPYYDVDPRVVKFLGTSLWNDTDTAREPALNGGWFPAASTDDQASFDTAFETAYGAPAGRLAALAYDAVGVVAALHREYGRDGMTAQNIERAQGFDGALGVFRFLPNGMAERPLAVLEVRNGRFIVIDPAAESFFTF